MRDDAQDLLLIQENDVEDLLGEAEEQKEEEIITNSRNFANKSSFTEFKKSFTHNELLKMRKSNN